MSVNTVGSRVPRDRMVRCVIPNAPQDMVGRVIPNAPQHPPRARRGSILAETVLVMPLLLMLIFGVIQFALIWTAKQMTAYAAFCATRAIMVVPPAEQQQAAQSAAEVALSWMCLAGSSNGADASVVIPGWGAIPGSSSVARRVTATIMASAGGGGSVISYNGTAVPIAAVEVRFSFPLMIPGMAVNKIIANAGTAPGLNQNVDFYGDLNSSAGNPNTRIDGVWPWLQLTETCVLPMPYSTANFPTGGFSGTSWTQTGGDS